MSSIVVDPWARINRNQQIRTRVVRNMCELPSVQTIQSNIRSVFRAPLVCLPSLGWGPVPEMIRLSNGGTDVLVDVTTGAPTIVHWGASLGAEVDLASVLLSLSRPIVHGTVDSVAPVSTVPEHALGFTGRPGLVGRRGGGLAWAPRFSAVSHHLSERRHASLGRCG